jgi:hypothetical protein
LSSAGVPRKLEPVVPPAPYAGDTQRYKRHMRNYMLNKSLQLRYILVVSLLSTAIVGVLGYLVYEQSSFASRKIVETINGKDMSWLDAGMKAEIQQSLHSADQYLLLVMAAVGIGLIAVLSTYLVVMTHKVAGPLYKILRYLDQIRDGRLPQVVDLRKGDQLQDFFAKFKAMNDAARQRTKADMEQLAAFVAACNAAGVAPDSELGLRLNELKTLVSDKEASLR